MLERGCVQLLLVASIVAGCRSAGSSAELVAPEVAWVRWKEGSHKEVAVCRIANRTDRDYDFFGFAPRRPVFVLWHQDEGGWRSAGRAGDHCTPLYTLAAGAELWIEVPLDALPGRRKVSMSFVEFQGGRWVQSVVETRPFPRR